MKFQYSKLVARVLVVALLLPVFARAAVSSHGAGGDACAPSSDAYSSRAGAPNDGASDAARIARLETQLDSLRQELKIPAYSAAIVKDQKVIWAKGFGYADVENKVPQPNIPLTTSRL